MRVPTLKIGESVAYKEYFKQKKFQKIKFVQTDLNQGQKSKKIFFFLLCIAYIANRVAHIELSIAFNLIPTSTS